MSESVRREILVVGAGIAGIGAARWLQNNAQRLGASVDLNVTIVEARSRIGGRIFTYGCNLSDSSDGDGTLDLGASWIHDPYSNPLTVIASNLKLGLKETDFEDTIVTDLTGKRWKDSVLDKIDKSWDRALFGGAAQARKSNQRDHSLQQVLDSKLDSRDPVIQQLMSELEFELGCPLRDCSATECIDDDWQLAMKDDSPDTVFRRLPKPLQDSNDMVLPHGYGQLMHALESGKGLQGTEMHHDQVGDDGLPLHVPLQIRFNEEVVSIDQTSVPGRVVVTVKKYACAYVDPVLDSRSTGTTSADAPSRECPFTGRADDGASFEAVEYVVDAVLVTVPIGVLQTGSITFSPPLSPAKRQAIDSTGFGNVVKVVMEFPRVFWPTHSPLLAIADAALANAQERGLLTYFLNGHFVAGKKVLVSYGLGDAAETVDQMSDEQLVALAMQRVRALALPGHVVPEAPTRIVRTAWKKDIYARGVYSCWKPGNAPGLRNELKRAEGRVWFAGEAVQESSLLSCSTHGAWLSGIEQAAAACACLGIPCVLPTILKKDKK